MIPVPMPTPGSDAALEGCCRCPVLDNAHGRGCGTWDDTFALGAVFWIRSDCPWHGDADPEAEVA